MQKYTSSHDILHKQHIAKPSKFQAALSTVIHNVTLINPHLHSFVYGEPSHKSSVALSN